MIFFMFLEIGPWGGGVMQSVCSRKPPYKIHEDLRDSSGKGSEKSVGPRIDQ